MNGCFNRINRIRLEFKEHVKFCTINMFKGINRIRLEFKENGGIRF